jgi:hypothetical protein
MIEFNTNEAARWSGYLDALACGTVMNALVVLRDYPDICERMLGSALAALVKDKLMMYGGTSFITLSSSNSSSELCRGIKELCVSGHMQLSLQVGLRHDMLSFSSFAQSSCLGVYQCVVRDMPGEMASPFFDISTMPPATALSCELYATGLNSLEARVAYSTATGQVLRGRQTYDLPSAPGALAVAYQYLLGSAFQLMHNVHDGGTGISPVAPTRDDMVVMHYAVQPAQSYGLNREKYDYQFHIYAAYWLTIFSVLWPPVIHDWTLHHIRPALLRLQHNVANRGGIAFEEALEPAKRVASTCVAGADRGIRAVFAALTWVRMCMSNAFYLLPHMSRALKNLGQTPHVDCAHDQQRYEAMQQRIVDLGVQLTSAIKDGETLLAQTTSLTKANEALQRTLDRERGERAKDQAKLQERTKEFEYAGKRFADSKKAMDKRDREVANLRKTVAEKDREIVHLWEEKNKEAKVNGSLRRDNVTLRHEVKNLEQKNARQAEEFESLQRSNEVLSRDIKRQKTLRADEKDNLRRKYCELQKKLSHVESVIADRERCIVELRERCTQLADRQRAMGKLLAYAKSEKADMESTLLDSCDQLKARSGQLEKQLEALQGENGALQRELAELSEIFANSQAAQQQELAVERQNGDELRAALADAESAKMALEERVEDLQHKLYACNKEKDGMEDGHRKVIDFMNLNYEGVDRERQQIGIDLQNAKREIRGLRELCTALEQHIVTQPTLVQYVVPVGQYALPPVQAYDPMPPTMLGDTKVFLTTHQGCLLPH